MKTKWDATDETRLAEEIVAALPPGTVTRFCADDGETVRFVVEAAHLKLRSVVLARASLRRLLNDAARSVKIEYLQRDLLRSATRRSEFRYPRLDRIVQAVRGRRNRVLSRLLTVAPAR